MGGRMCKHKREVRIEIEIEVKLKMKVNGCVENGKVVCLAR
jgi:hypothetical protein